MYNNINKYDDAQLKIKQEIQQTIGGNINSNANKESEDVKLNEENKKNDNELLGKGKQKEQINWIRDIAEERRKKEERLKKLKEVKTDNFRLKKENIDGIENLGFCNSVENIIASFYYGDNKELTYKDDKEILKYLDEVININLKRKFKNTIKNIEKIFEKYEYHQANDFHGWDWIYDYSFGWKELMNMKRELFCKCRLLDKALENPKNKSNEFVIKNYNIIYRCKLKSILEEEIKYLSIVEEIDKKITAFYEEAKKKIKEMGKDIRKDYFWYSFKRDAFQKACSSVFRRIILSVENIHKKFLQGSIIDYEMFDRHYNWFMREVKDILEEFFEKFLYSREYKFNYSDNYFDNYSDDHSDDHSD